MHTARPIQATAETRSDAMMTDCYIRRVFFVPEVLLLYFMHAYGTAHIGDRQTDRQEATSVWTKGYGIRIGAHDR